SPVVVTKPCEKKVASEREEEIEEKSEGEVEQKNECEIEEEVTSEIEGEVEKQKRVKEDPSVKKGKKSLVSEPKYQDPSPYARVPFPRRKKVIKNQDMEFRKFMKMLNKIEMTIP
ncbi:hypothetical protein A2U01_0063903, partial [Trifolium medium]|nr:hypothetical protein [Trifolium medium]